MRPLEKSGVKSLTLRHIWWPWRSFRLGWTFLWVCLRRKSRTGHRALGSAALGTESLKLCSNWLRRPLPRGARHAALIAIAVIALGGLPRLVWAQTWTPPSPGSNVDFNNPVNWTPVGVPTGTAFFGPVMDPDAKLVEIFSTTPLTQFQFQADAVNYSIGVFSGGTVQFSGGGLTNLSVITQEIIVEPGGTLSFDDSTAGDTTIHYGNRGGTISFSDASTAGSANFENQSGGAMTFAGNSTAGNAVIANDFGTGTITFAGSSTAGSAAITNNSLGDINFNITSTAGNASITNNGSLSFNNFSTAGSATITNNNTLFFTNNSTAGNATINNNDFMHFVDNSTGGDAAITNSSGAVTDF
jgi:hypothetical protein